jgi:SAM-dependent methyltransferase
MALSEYGGRHVSFDISLGQLALGEALIRDRLAASYFPGMDQSSIGWVHGNAEQPMPFRDRVADVTYGIGVLNHLSLEKWDAYLKDMKRITKPGGIVFHVVPNIDCEIYSRHYITEQFKNPEAMQYNTQFVTRESVKEAFTRAGMEEVEVSALWMYDNDSFPSILRALDIPAAKLKAMLPARVRSLSMHIEKYLLDAVNGGKAWARKWRLNTPRHLLVWGKAS